MTASVATHVFVFYEKPKVSRPPGAAQSPKTRRFPAARLLRTAAFVHRCTSQGVASKAHSHSIPPLFPASYLTDAGSLGDKAHLLLAALSA